MGKTIQETGKWPNLSMRCTRYRDKVDIRWLPWVQHWLEDWGVVDELQKLQRTSFSGVKGEAARIIGNK
ncbi:hypothetical protein QYM36_006834, partial [Artemia franciscana]